MSAVMRPGSDGCWREMGRPGPGTCPELERHVSCRNCPHYAEAALRLLDRPAPADYRREWTDHLAGEERSTLDAGTTAAFVFRLGAEWLSLPCAVVEQVAEPSIVHALPHRALPVRGLVSVRGELVVCVSLHALLGIEDAPAEAAAARPYGRMLVLAGEDGRAAFTPSEVYGLHRYHPGDLLQAPMTIARSSPARFTTELFSWNGRTVGCLDAPRLLAALSESLS